MILQPETFQTPPTITETKNLKKKNLNVATGAEIQTDLRRIIFPY